MSGVQVMLSMHTPEQKHRLSVMVSAGERGREGDRHRHEQTGREIVRAANHHGVSSSALPIMLSVRFCRIFVARPSAAERLTPRDMRALHLSPLSPWSGAGPGD